MVDLRLGVVAQLEADGSELRDGCQASGLSVLG
jgi:hypothetical protein